MGLRRRRRNVWPWIIWWRLWRKWWIWRLRIGPRRAWHPRRLLRLSLCPLDEAMHDETRSPHETPDTSHTDGLGVRAAADGLFLRTHRLESHDGCTDHWLRAIARNSAFR